MLKRREFTSLEPYDSVLIPRKHQVLDGLDSVDVWQQVQIVDVRDERDGPMIKVNYIGWDEQKYDEWINIESYRIAPLHTYTAPRLLWTLKASNSAASTGTGTGSNSSGDGGGGGNIRLLYPAAHLQSNWWRVFP